MENLKLQIEKLSPKKGEFIVIKLPEEKSPGYYEYLSKNMADALETIGQDTGVKFLIVHSNVEVCTAPAEIEDMIKDKINEYKESQNESGNE